MGYTVYWHSGEEGLSYNLTFCFLFAFLPVQNLVWDNSPIL